MSYVIIKLEISDAPIIRLANVSADVMDYLTTITIGIIIGSCTDTIFMCMCN